MEWDVGGERGGGGLCGLREEAGSRRGWGSFPWEAERVLLLVEKEKKNALEGMRLVQA